MSAIMQHPLFLILVVFIAFFFNLSAVPLFDLDEGAFSEATREMLAAGNFAATYLDGAPRYDKPILSYWLQAVSVSLFGFNEWALRLPSAIAASLWLIALYRFTVSQFNRETAITACLLMATTLWIALIGRAAIADAWLNLFITLTMFEIYRFWQAPSAHYARRAFLWMALGMLTKGPIAVLIPLVVSFLFFVGKGRWRLWLSAIFTPSGWLIFIAVLSPWLFMVYNEQGIDFFYGFIVEHNIERFSDTREGHGGHYYYFLAVLPLILLPYSGGVLELIWRTRIWIQDDLNQFLVIWFVFVFVFMSVSQTQLPHYILYGCTGLFIMMSRYHRKVFRASWQVLFPLLFFVIMLALPNLLALALEDTKRAYEFALIARALDVLPSYWYTYAGITTVLIIIIWLLPCIERTQRLILAGILQVLFVFMALVPYVANVQQVPVKQAAQFATQHYPLTPVVTYAIKMPSFSVYRDAITPRQAPLPGYLVFTRVDKLERLRAEYDQFIFDEVFAEGGVRLLMTNPKGENN